MLSWPRERATEDGDLAAAGMRGINHDAAAIGRESRMQIAFGFALQPGRRIERSQRTNLLPLAGVVQHMPFRQGIRITVEQDGIQLAGIEVGMAIASAIDRRQFLPGTAGIIRHDIAKPPCESATVNSRRRSSSHT